MRRSIVSFAAATAALLGTAMQAAAVGSCPPGSVLNGSGTCVPSTPVPEISAVAGVAAVAALAAGVALLRERFKG